MCLWTHNYLQYGTVKRHPVVYFSIVYIFWFFVIPNEIIFVSCSKTKITCSTKLAVQYNLIWEVEKSFLFFF